MKLIRFILPFLFVRNWYDGTWELSTARLVTFVAFLLLWFISLTIVAILQAPVIYTAPL